MPPNMWFHQHLIPHHALAHLAFKHEVVSIRNAQGCRRPGSADGSVATRSTTPTTPVVQMFADELAKHGATRAWTRPAGAGRRRWPRRAEPFSIFALSSGRREGRSGPNLHAVR